mmetsp:Transcript_946/g.2153  ORF Transcript_946/g.2153 Transcript_946/m.2153 type:complete len:150 (-) Transcript_946:117-566(-)
MHCQSVALARYAGKLGGFYPEDPVQALIVDEAIESLNELMAVAPKRYERVHAETTILFVFYKKVMILICSAHKTENICPPLSSPDADELLKLRKEFQAGPMTKFANFFEDLIQQNGGVGFASTPSIADLTLWGTVKSIRTGDWTGIDAT